MGDFQGYVLEVNPEPYPWAMPWGTRYNFGSDWAEVIFTFDGDGHYTCGIDEKFDDVPEDGEMPAELGSYIGDVWGATELEQACLTLEDDMRDILEIEGKDPESF